MRLIWIRHGEMSLSDHRVSDFATVNRLFNQEMQGPLSERGRGEAARVAQHFTGHPVDAVYASPMTRAHQTAEPTAEALGLALQIVPDIGELRTGHLPAGSLAETLLGQVVEAPLLPGPVKRVLLGVTLIPLYFHSWRQGLTRGGETKADVEARLRRTISLLARSHPAQARVALFAHGYLIFFLCATLLEPTWARWLVWRKPYIANGAITEIELGTDGSLRLLSFASTKHLR